MKKIYMTEVYSQPGNAKHTIVFEDKDKMIAFLLEFVKDNYEGKITKHKISKKRITPGSGLRVYDADHGFTLSIILKDNSGMQNIYYVIKELEVR